MTKKTNNEKKEDLVHRQEMNAWIKNSEDSSIDQDIDNILDHINLIKPETVEEDPDENEEQSTVERKFKGILGSLGKIRKNTLTKSQQEFMSLFRKEILKILNDENLWEEVYPHIPKKTIEMLIDTACDQWRSGTNKTSRKKHKSHKRSFTCTTIDEDSPPF